MSSGGLLPELQMCREPNRIVVMIDPAERLDTDFMAEQAVFAARQNMPKVTGGLAFGLQPIHGLNYFGIYFPDKRVWFQEQGTRPFTMNNVAGKTIPMWVEDVSDAVKRNPKTKQRTTVDGRVQYLIFRKAAVKGQQRRTLRRSAGGGAMFVNVPACYPGAPGRIRRREASAPLTTAGRTGGRIAPGNGGVRWRNPGIVGRKFMNAGLTEVCDIYGLSREAAYLVDEVTFYPLVRN